MKTILKRSLALAAVAATISLGACNNAGNQNTDQTIRPDSVATTPAPDMHHAKNSLDWAGSYFGKLPCASCPGINTIITLNEDGTYNKTEEYIEEKGAPLEENGKFEWQADSSTIKLGEAMYFVGENQLIMLDADGKKIEGELAENYILKKTELMPDPEFNDGMTQQSFIGNDNKEYQITFDTNGEKPTAYIVSGNFSEMLTQQSASAKSAEYTGGKVSLSVTGDVGTLTIQGKKIALKAKK